LTDAARKAFGFIYRVQNTLFILYVTPVLLGAFLPLCNILRGSEQEGRFLYPSIKCLTQNVKMCVQANSKTEDKTSCVAYSEDHGPNVEDDDF